jgi:hypothetical protein
LSAPSGFARFACAGRRPHGKAAIGRPKRAKDGAKSGGTPRAIRRFDGTVLTFIGGVGGAVIGGVALMLLIGALILMRNSRKLGETT